MHNKLLIAAFMLATVLIGGALYMSRYASVNRVPASQGIEVNGAAASVGQAVMEQGTQYVDIAAHAGYSPRVTKAKAGVATVIRMSTQNTYDCSTSLVIPAIGYQGYLKASGATEIAVPAGKAAGTLFGSCSMGMYRFQIEFE